MEDNINHSRSRLIAEFPHYFYIDDKDESDNAFSWCEEQNLKLKIDFDVRQSHRGHGKEFYIKDSEVAIAFKIRWQ